MINAGIDRVSLGSLTTKIALYAPRQQKNAKGAIENSYEKVADVYANVVEVPQMEGAVDSNLVALNMIDVKMYIVKDLTTRWRVEYDGQMYNILSKSQAERQPIMVLRAERIME